MHRFPLFALPASLVLLIVQAAAVEGAPRLPAARESNLQAKKAGRLQPDSGVAPGAAFSAIEDKLRSIGIPVRAADNGLALRPAEDCRGQEIALDATVDGAIAAGDCKISEILGRGTSEFLADAYRITVPRTGVLTVRMQSQQIDSLVLLLNSELSIVGANDDEAEGSNDALLTIHVPPGAYTIVATAFEQGEGAYKLSLSFGNLRTCNITDLALDQELSGELSDTDCRGLDVREFGTDTTLIDRFRVRLDRQGVLTVTMNSEATVPMLVLIEEGGQLVGAENNRARGSMAKLTISLPAGTYILHANTARDGLGAYVLKASFEQPRTCSSSDLQLGNSRQGELLETGCRVLDLFLRSSNTNLVDQYRFELAERKVVTLEMTSDTFDTFLVLYDSSLRVVDSDDDGAGGTNSRLVTSLEPGTYTVFARTFDPGTGAYALASNVENLRECRRTPLEAGASAQGSLDAEDCRVLDLFVPASDTTAVDIYGTRLSGRGVLRIAVNTEAFDSVAAVTDLDYTVISAVGDPGGDKNSVLDLLLNPGDYLLLVNSNDDLGPYEISTTLSEPRACPMMEISLSGRVIGELNEEDCRIRDFLPGTTIDWLAEQFRFNVPDTRTVTVEASSTGFKPLLLLVGIDNDTAALDANPSGSNTAVISRSLERGSYQVILTTASGTGEFTLSTSSSGGGGGVVSGGPPAQQ